jgi:replicative DNA helicase Mcm
MQYRTKIKANPKHKLNTLKSNKPKNNSKRWKMEIEEAIEKFKEFFQLYYESTILNNVKEDKKFLIADFIKLSQYDIELSEYLLEEPTQALEAANAAIMHFNVEEDLEGFNVRFRNLAESRSLSIRDIRSVHLSKLFCFEGLVRQKSDVRPKATSAKFRCKNCGQILVVLQNDNKFKKPARCGCGNKTHFDLIGKNMIDVQRIVLEEMPEKLHGADQPKRIGVILSQDLVSPITERKTNPGSKVKVSGIIRETPITLRTGGTSTKFDLFVEANFIEPLQEEFSELAINKEEEERIQNLGKDKQILKKLIDSMAPSIYGYDQIKEALLLQMFSGVEKVRADGARTRGDIHILLVGDPGAGKSQLLKRASLVAPKARYVSGKGASGAGLTATVVKDEFLRGWALEAGALVLTNNGLCVIDELDKMSTDDRSAMHEALEQQTISISKANVQATLLAKTTVLAAANPKFGRFDPYDSIAKQINLPPALINRFDLIFTIKDLPNKDKDTALAEHVLSSHQDPDKYKAEIDTDFLRKYIAYAKRKLKPTLTANAIKEFKEYYVNLRNKDAEEQNGIKAIPISPRQLEALVRLGEASARARLSEKVTKKDAKVAIDIINFCLRDVGVDPTTGKLDIDRIATGVTASERSKVSTVKSAIAMIEEKLGKNTPISKQDIIKVCEEYNISSDDAEEILEKLKRSGDIFEPKYGFIQRL